MPQVEFNTIVQKLESVLNPRFLNQIGKETGFAERLREILPSRLATATVGALGTQQVSSLADILRKFNAISPVSVQYKPFHNQLRKEAFPRHAGCLEEGT